MSRRIRAEPGRSLWSTLSYLDLGAEFDDPVRRYTEEIGGPRRYAHEPGGLAVYDDLLARFGTAIELPLRKRVAKALFNKAITLGTLDRSEEEMPRLPSLNSRATSPRMDSPDSPLREMDSNFRFRTREATDLSFRFLSMSLKLSAF